MLLLFLPLFSAGNKVEFLNVCVCVVCERVVVLIDPLDLPFFVGFFGCRVWSFVGIQRFLCCLLLQSSIFFISEWKQSVIIGEKRKLEKKWTRNEFLLLLLLSHILASYDDIRIAQTIIAHVILSVNKLLGMKITRIIICIYLAEWFFCSPLLFFSFALWAPQSHC